jgi:POT family proton-dependent oligopeptide transporter
MQTNLLHGETAPGRPPRLHTLFFTAMWERCSYYGMRALLILFMTAAVQSGGLGFSDLNVVKAVHPG